MTTVSRYERATQVVVVRALQLGDMLCSVPALRALRRACPSARISLIGLPWASAFVDRFADYVDELIAFPGYPGIPEQPLEVRRLPDFFTNMQERRFDLALQLHGSGQHINNFVLQLGAEASAGFYVRGMWRPAPSFRPYPSHLPERSRLLSLLRDLGIPATDDRLEFPLRSEDADELASVAGDVWRGVEYACLHPGARDPRRRWPPDRFAAIGDLLEQRGLRVIITGTAEEAALTASMAASMRRRSLDLTGRLSLGALGALIDGARLVVCNDTGVSHLADALDVPSVIVFSGSDPARWGPRDRRRHRVVRGVVGEQLEHCCLGEDCRHAQLRPLDVPIDSVAREVEALLDKGWHRAA